MQSHKKGSPQKVDTQLGQGEATYFF